MSTVLIIFNHPYQIENFHIDSHESYLFVNISTTKYISSKYNSLPNCRFHYCPLVEALGVFDVMSHRLDFSFLSNVKSIIFFGVQDFHSYAIAKKASSEGICVEIVPDNLEFYLRPQINISQSSKSNAKYLLKSLLFGAFLDFLRGDIRFWESRPIYSLEKINFKVCEEFAFYNKKLPKPNAVVEVDGEGYSIGFISQPYYDDYGLNLEEWVEILHKIVKRNEFSGEKLIVYLHPRDSEIFKHELEKKKIPFTYTKIFPEKVIGIFSTLLFQLALNKYKVSSVLDDFKHMFPNHYSSYLDLGCRTFGVSDGLNVHWEVSLATFLKLNSYLKGKS